MTAVVDCPRDSLDDDALDLVALARSVNSWDGVGAPVSAEGLGAWLVDAGLAVRDDRGRLPLTPDARQLAGAASG